MAKFSFDLDPSYRPDGGKNTFRPDIFNSESEIIAFIAKNLEALMMGVQNNYQDHPHADNSLTRWILVEPFTTKYQDEEVLVERHYWIQKNEVILFVFPSFTILFADSNQEHPIVLAQIVTDPDFIPQLMRMLRNLN